MESLESRIVQGRSVAEWRDMPARFLRLLSARYEQLGRRERDEHHQKLEPPGSYELCWKFYDWPDGGKMACSKKIGHTDVCGEGET